MTQQAARLVLEGRLGHRFGDPDRLTRALTHPSWAREHGSDDYERLEFLGDSVLGLLVAEYVHEQFPDRPEGQLTRMKVSVVHGGALAQTARELGVGEALLMGHGAAQAGESDRDSVLEAAMEALVGAVYLDGGLEAARGVVSRCMGPLLRPEALEGLLSDAKTRLQELTQAGGLGLPVYRLIAQTGPDHDRVFTVEAAVDGVVRGVGSGGSKRQAETLAAAQALEALEQAR